MEEESAGGKSGTKNMCLYQPQLKMNISFLSHTWEQ